MATVKEDRHTADGIVTAVAFAAAAFLLWQGAEYSGLVAWAAEWQFGRVDRYWPTLTVALAVLLGLAIVLVVKIVRRRRKRREIAALAPAEQYRLAVEGERRLLRISVAIAAVALVGALFCLITALRITDAGPVRTVDAARATEPVEGQTRLLGRVDMTHIAVLTRTVLFARQQLFFAPIVEPSGRARYLVELERIETPRERWIAPRQGLLQRFPTARELAALYYEKGVGLDDNPYALLRSADTLRWTWWAATAQCAVFGLIAALFALLFRRRRNRRAAMLSQETPAAAES